MTPPKLEKSVCGAQFRVAVRAPSSIVITTGRHAGLVESLRVQEITLAIDDDTSAATATFTLGQPKPDKRWNLRTFDKRIAQLAKR